METNGNYIMFKQNEIENIKNVKSKIIQQLNDIQTTPWGRYVMSHRRNVFLTGGAIGSLLRGEEVNDWDFYFKDQRVAKDVRNTLINKYSDSIKEYSSSNYPGAKTENIDGNKDKIITNNAITMEGNVQLITVLSGAANELLKSFDYVHCMPYFDCGDNKLYISEKQYYAIMNKVLIVNNVESATKNTHRKEKFIQRGFKEYETQKLSKSSESLSGNDWTTILTNPIGINTITSTTKSNILSNSHQRIEGEIY